MTRFCPYCGTTIRDRARFCPKCGKSTPPRRQTVALEEAAAPAHKPQAELIEKMNRAAVAKEPLPSFDKATAQKPDFNGSNGKGAVTTDLPYAPPTHAYIGVFEQAGFGLRYGAWMFDFLITLIVMMTFTFLVTAIGNQSVMDSNRDLLLVSGLTLLLFVLNFIVLAGLTGQSAGMKILGIQITHTDGRPFTIKSALLRHLLGYPLSVAALFLGFLWMLWDPRQQGWHDKLAKTIVVMSR
jgi:uncharacterized RDD family membrane protein YckC